MSFSLPRFLRRVQPSDLIGLASILRRSGYPFSEQVDWTAKTAALVESVKTAIETFPERERERVFEDFERIDQISDEIGQRALRSLIKQDEALLHRFHSCNPRQTYMWVFWALRAQDVCSRLGKGAGP